MAIGIAIWLVGLGVFAAGVAIDSHTVSAMAGMIEALGVYKVGRAFE